jgi:hypothetical protein
MGGGVGVDLDRLRMHLRLSSRLRLQPFRRHSKRS